MSPESDINLAVFVDETKKLYILCERDEGNSLESVSLWVYLLNVFTINLRYIALKKDVSQMLVILPNKI